MIGMLSLPLMQSKISINGLVGKCVEDLTFLLDNIYIRVSSKLYRQIVGITMGTNCAPFVADLFLFFMRETSCCLFQIITNLKLLKVSILLLGMDSNSYAHRYLFRA